MVECRWVKVSRAGGASRFALLCLVACHMGSLCKAQCPVNPVPGSRQNTPVAAFVQAAHRGDLEAVNAALKAGIDVNATPEYGWTALHSAAERSHVEVLKRLIEVGADVNATEYLDVTALHWAAARGPVEAVKALIDAGADVNAHCVQHDTPLVAAGEEDIIEALIEAGADVNGVGYMTPLAEATRCGNVSKIKLLVKHGAKVNDENNPPLHWAGKPEVAKALLDAGADVDLRNPDGETALHLTTGAWIPDASTLKVLIDAGADVNVRTKAGATPLHRAIWREDLEMVKLLLDHGADPNAKDEGGDTPLSLAELVGESFVALVEAAGAKDDGRTDLLRAVEAGELDHVRTLIHGGADVNESGLRGRTPVYAASKVGRVDILNELIEAGAKVDRRNAQEQRPLHVAASAEIAERLIAAGAKVGERRGDLSWGSPTVPTPLYVAIMDGRTDVARVLIRSKAEVNPRGAPGPLIWAVFAGRTEIVEALLEAGAQVQRRGPFDESALHVVARGAIADMRSPEHVAPEIRLKIAQLLVDHGAEVNDKCNIGFFHDSTPLECAASDGHFEMVKLFLDHGAEVNFAPSSGTFAGYTALHGAADEGNVKVVQLLLQRQANVNALTGEENFKGVQTPLDLAEEPAVVELLKKHGGKRASELK